MFDIKSFFISCILDIGWTNVNLLFLERGLFCWKGDESENLLPRIGGVLKPPPPPTAAPGAVPKQSEALLPRDHLLSFIAGLYPADPEEVNGPNKSSFMNIPFYLKYKYLPPSLMILISHRFMLRSSNTSTWNEKYLWNDESCQLCQVVKFIIGVFS